MSATPVHAIGPLFDPSRVTQDLGVAAPGRLQSANAFGQLLLNGVNDVSQKVANADKLATQFALDDTVPLHEVTFALQQARLSLEFMLQVRTRLVDAYQQFAGVQL